MIARFQVIVVTPERPGTRDCMMWVAMKGGVVAYVRAHWQGTPDEAEAMMLEHLRQGMDALPDMKRRDESWQPMVYAPLDPLVLGNEIRRRVHDAYDLMQVSIGQFHLYFAAAANAEQWMSEFVGLLEKEAIDIWSNIPARAGTRACS